MKFLTPSGHRILLRIDDYKYKMENSSSQLLNATLNYHTFGAHSAVHDVYKHKYKELIVGRKLNKACHVRVLAILHSQQR